MAGAKVDVQAVNAELNGIAARMGEVTRLMGPQVWQGGSAGNFTVDLQGHNRSLGQMMMQVMKAAAALNKLPMVLDVPAMPSVTPAVSNGVASVSPSGLQRLESALRQAADALPRHGQRIQALISEAGPHDVSTAQCTRTAAWCQDQAKPMRMRIHYALASDNVSPLVGVMTRGMAQVPDGDRFGRSQMEQLAMLQAQAYQKQLENPTEASQGILADIGTSLRESSTDANYLKTFFENVPMGSVGKLGYSLHMQHKDDTVLNNVDKKILSDFGTTLAALSRRKDQASTDAAWNALGHTGSDMPSQAMLVKFSAPDVKWGSQMLAELGKASLRWRQTHPSYEIDESSGILAGEPRSTLLNQPHREWWKDWGIDGDDLKKMREYDPALGVLGRIKDQNDTAAARALAGANLNEGLLIKDPEKAPALSFLTRSNGDTYASLLVSPDWLDRGAAAGAVIRLATTPEKGHEEEVAQIAAETMKSVAWWNETGRTKVDKLLRGTGVPDWFTDSKQYKAEYGDNLRDGLLQMIRMHIPSLAHANRTESGTGLPDIDQATGQTYVGIGGKEVQQFLRTFASDDLRWGQLALDTQAYRRRVFAWGVRDRSLYSATTLAGYLDGNLIQAYAVEQSSRQQITKQEYEDAKNHLTMVRDAGGSFLGVTPVGQNPIVTSGYELGSTWLLDKVKYSDFEKRMDAIKQHDASYSDHLYVDLARGYRSNMFGPLSDPRADTLLASPSLSGGEQSELIRWTQKLTFEGADPTSGSQKIRGADVIRWTEDAVDHNSPVASGQSSGSSS